MVGIMREPGMPEFVSSVILLTEVQMVKLMFQRRLKSLSSLNSRNISGHMLFVMDLLIAQKNSLIRCLMFLLFMARNRLIFCVHDTTQ